MIFTGLLVSLLLLTQSFLCMEKPVLYREKVTRDLTLIHQAIIAHQILCNPGLFSHDSLCALALVDKHFNARVEESAPQRKAHFIFKKEYCEIHQKTPSIYNQKNWHKYKSAFTYWTDTKKIVDERKEKQITLNLVHFDSNYSICHRQFQCLTTDIKSNTLIFKGYNPFFNAKGNVCFHALGQFQLQKGAEDNALFSPSFRPYIFEYSMNTKGLEKQLPCYVINVPTDKDKNTLTNLVDLKDNPNLLQTIITSKPAIETSIKKYDQLKIYTKHCKDYKGNIKIYNYTDETESSKDRTSEFLKNPNTPKRLNFEINKLLENKKLIIDAYSVNSKTHPFEIKITIYNDETEHIITCKIPKDYPFNAPIILLEVTDDQLEPKDLIAIKKVLNEKINSPWSPSKQIFQMIDLAEAEIKSHKNKKIASQQIAQGHKRTFAHLKEKYLSKNVALGNKYPEFQEKFHGLWIKEMSDGYFVFHVEGDYINIAFEPKYICEAPLSYHGNYAAEYHNTKNNFFKIHISDLADSGKINTFNIVINFNLISITFNSLKENSILDTITSHLQMGYVIGKEITLTKI